MLRPQRLVFFVASIVLATSALRAQNLVQNGEFDHDLAHWTALAQENLSKVSWTGAIGFDDDVAAVRGSVLIAEARGDSFDRYNGVKQCLSPGVLPSPLVVNAFASSRATPAPANGAGIDTELIVQFWNGAGCTGAAIGEQRLATPAQGRWTNLRAGINVPSGAKSILLYLVVVKRFPSVNLGNPNAEAAFDDVYVGPFAANPPCFMNDLRPNSSELCLRYNQFKVTAEWKTATGATGFGVAVPLSDDTGSFYFFDPVNTEMIVKVINACSLNHRYWIFAGGLTDVEVTLTVTETRTGQTKTYKNPLGKKFTPFQDTSAFATCPPS
jgi:hypothetical protein